MTRGGKITETHIKGQVKDYLAAKCIFNYHVLQGMGAYAGLPDRVMHFDGRVVYLEIKKPKGTMSDFQLAFQQQCLEDAIGYFIIRSIEDLEEMLGEL